MTMAEERIGYAVVGVKGIGRGHIEAVRACAEEAELVAVCDIDEEAARAVAEKYEVPHAMRDFDQLLKLEEVQALSICTPHFLHRDMTVAALEAGKHVLCEKPMAVTVKQAEEMVGAAKKVEKALAISFQHRFRPEVGVMRKLASEMAPLLWLVWIDCAMRTQAYYDSGDWRGTWWGEGGGVLINQAVHDLDLLQWVFGMPLRVLGRASTLLHDIEVEDISSAVFEYENGAQGTFVVGSVSYPLVHRVQAGFDGGVVLYDGKLRVARVKGRISEFIKRSPEVWGSPEVEWEEPEVPQVERGGHAAAVHDFLRAIKEGNSPICPGEEGVKSTELVNAIIISTIKGEPVALPLDREECEGVYEGLNQGRLQIPRFLL